MTDEWSKWSNHVLAELKRLNGDINSLRQDVSYIKQEVKVLTVKAGVWGLMGGAIPIMVTLLFMLLKSA